MRNDRDRFANKCGETIGSTFRLIAHSRSAERGYKSLASGLLIRFRDKDLPRAKLYYGGVPFEVSFDPDDLLTCREQT